MARAEKRKTGWQGIALCDGSCASAHQYGHCKGHKRGLSGHATKKDALAAAYATERHLKLQGATKHAAQTLTLDEVAQLWLDSDRDVKESTVTWYRNLWSAWTSKDPKLVTTPITAITPLRVSNWLKTLRNEGLAKSTLRSHLVLLRSICGYAVHPMQLIDTNPCTGIKPPKSTKPAVTDHGRFTPDELLAIADAVANSK